MIESLEVLKTSRKQVKQKADDKCQQVEQITEIIGQLELENEEDVVQWLAIAKEAIKIKEEDAE